MGYRRIGKWIDWQAEKQGVPLAIVSPKGTSSECPKCGSKELEEAGYRRLRCLKSLLNRDTQDAASKKIGTSLGS
jgi:transposase